MGRWKPPLSLRMWQAVRAETENFGARERRTLENLEEWLEWSVV